MVVRKFHNKDIRQSDSLLTLNKSLYLSVILDFWWWKFFEIAFQCVLVQVVVVLYVPICFICELIREVSWLKLW